jgi:hypothetical protein
LHKYLYAEGDPVTNLDPSGYVSITEQQIAFLAASAIFTMATLQLVKTVSDLTIKITLHPQFPRPQPSPSPDPVPGSPKPFPIPTPDQDSNHFVNFDTSTAEAIAMEGSTESTKIYMALADTSRMESHAC